ncbi:hypothetical protein MXB_5005, partial [Myxobolus squamalis]
MVDDGETKVQAMIREATEEVLNLTNADELSRGISWLERNIPKGVDLFSGYVKDRRNTDNAWIETSVRSCIESPRDKIDFQFKAGSDAADAFWTEELLSPMLHS